MFPSAIWEPVWESILLFLPRMLIAVVVLVAFWAAGNAAEGVVRRLGLKRSVETSIVNLLAGGAKIGMILLGAVTALGTLGIDVSALVAGLGLTGLAIGLALKEIISNALSGILVIVYKPFRENDVIAVTTFEGTVREINLRFTTLESEGKKIYIPNAMVVNNAVIVRRQYEIGLP